MSRSFWCARAGVFVAVLFGLANFAAAQNPISRADYYKKVVEASGKLPPHYRALLSPGMKNFLRYAAAQAQQGSAMTSGSARPAAAASTSLIAPSAARLLPSGPAGTSRVSDPNLDFVNSVLGGFTQDTSSTARCGNSVVVGYQDAGARLRTEKSAQPFEGPASEDGVSFSSNSGANFIDLGFLPPGSNPANFLGGDPAVACGSSRLFYYVSNFSTATPLSNATCPGCPLTAVSISVSFNGGAVWSDPAPAAEKDGTFDFFQKPWIAIDPTNPTRLYVSFTDVASAANDSRCGTDSESSIQVVASSDGGKTWTAPVVIDVRCGVSQLFVTGSNIAVSPSGTVYVAYEEISNAAPSEKPTNQIFFASSSNHAGTFTTPLSVAKIVPPGDGNIASEGNQHLQGGFEINQYPQIAVDRSSGPSRGTIYITWAGGTTEARMDADSPTGSYHYTDASVATSTNGGGSFTMLPPISPTPANFRGKGRDQFLPAVAVDRRGAVGVCYYDRRGDVLNVRVDRFCSISHNHGASWEDEQLTNLDWQPFHCSDLVVFCSEISSYDSLTTDFLLETDGFFGAFEIQQDGNADLVAKAVF